MMVTTLSLGLLVLYESFLRLRGWAYYWQRLAIVNVSLVRILSSRHWCLWAFQRNKRRPQIVATQKRAVNKIAAAASDQGKTRDILWDRWTEGGGVSVGEKGKEEVWSWMGGWLSSQIECSGTGIASGVCDFTKWQSCELVYQKC